MTKTPIISLGFLLVRMLRKFLLKISTMNPLVLFYTGQMQEIMIKIPFSFIEIITQFYQNITLYLTIFKVNRKEKVKKGKKMKRKLLNCNKLQIEYVDLIKLLDIWKIQRISLQILQTFKMNQKNLKIFLTKLLNLYKTFNSNSIKIVYSLL